MFLSWLILKEDLTIYFILGFSLIFVAVVISEWEKSRLAKKNTSEK
jgi:drug/metabolite transporter (DMT)-like permease